MQIPSGILVSGDNIEETHVEWGERSTFLMTFHRPLPIKSLSTAVSYAQSHDHEAQYGNNKPQSPYSHFGY